MTIYDMLSLKGKRVFISGGAGYLGSKMCEVICELGGNLIVGSRNVKQHNSLMEKLLGINEGVVEFISLDLSNLDSIDKVTRHVIEKYGGVDVLINNAYYGGGRELHTMSDDLWLKGIDGSINSVFRLTSRLIPNMIENRYGKIINIASMYGSIAPDVSIYRDNDFYNPPNYGVGKAGIIQLTKYIAAVYGRYGINCNAISPGPFPSDTVRKDKEFLQSLNEKVPMGRVGGPDELKGVVGLLASDASSYINGANIPVDGGWTVW